MGGGDGWLVLRVTDFFVGNKSSSALNTWLEWRFVKVFITCCACVYLGGRNTNCSLFDIQYPTHVHLRLQPKYQVQNGGAFFFFN